MHVKCWNTSFGTNQFSKVRYPKLILFTITISLTFILRFVCQPNLNETIHRTRCLKRRKPSVSRALSCSEDFGQFLSQQHIRLGPKMSDAIISCRKVYTWAIMQLRIFKAVQPREYPRKISFWDGGNCTSPHTEKSFRNLIKSNWNQIVFTIFRLILIWFNKIWKRFVCV